ncbi:hypothetical protein [Streptomyces sp. NPDC014676]|uniref:hypothetical protein n=1 Tax=Streptomyces sp. NPDC014676 TaxID=3364879 RepID=UPI0036FB6C8B
MVEFDGTEVVALEDAAAFEDWPAGHHTRCEGVWVKVAKKASGTVSVTDDELVDVGLRWGWIPGQHRAWTTGTTCRSTGHGDGPNLHPRLG